MAENATTAMGTRRSQSVNRALKTVEKVLLSIRDDSERLVVVVSTYFTARHNFRLLTSLCFDERFG